MKVKKKNEQHEVIDKKELLDWIRHILLTDGWVGELGGTYDLTLLKILESKIKNGEFDIYLPNYENYTTEQYLKNLRIKAMSWLSKIKPDDWMKDIRGYDK